MLVVEYVHPPEYLALEDASSEYYLPPPYSALSMLAAISLDGRRCDLGGSAACCGCCERWRWYSWAMR